MTVNRTTLLDLPLPVTGTEAGTWGDTTNNGLSQYMDIAIAGMNSLTSANFTAGALTIANTQGDSSATNIAAGSAQYATIKVSSLAVNSTITAPSSNRSYRIINADATYSLTIKASGQTGVTFLPGQTGVVAFNGTDYVIVGVVGAGTATDNAVARFDGTTGEIIQNSGVTIDDSNNVSGIAQLNITTLDATNIEVTNIKAKDGTAAASIADSTGVISVTANPVLSGGTANGVAYLNGSKVLTTGSALTFDGTIFSNALTANATYSELLRLRNNGAGDNTGAKLSFNFSGTERGYVGTFFSSGWITEISGTDVTRFLLGGSEQMRLTSTGLGIGTSSPSYKLDVAQVNPTRGIVARIQNSASASLTGTQINFLQDTIDNWAIGMPAGVSAFTFWASRTSGADGTEIARFTNTGNLGLGVTPSAWAVYKSFDSGSCSFNTAGVQGELTSNGFFNASSQWIYKATGFANRYVQNLSATGVHAWFTAPSGTAGNAISFTQAMTLDASGNLGIGATSPTGKLSVYGGSLPTGVTAGYGLSLSSILTATRLTTDSSGHTSYIGSYFDDTALEISQGTSSTYTSGIVIAARSATNTVSDAVAVFTRGTERMRIDSSGNLLIGTTSYSSAPNAGVTIAASGVFNIGNTAGTSGWGFLTFNRSGVGIGSITQSGTTEVLYNTTSDYRLKNVIGVVSGAGERIDALEPIEYEWKSDGSRTRGFLAHKVQEVYPNSVTGKKDAVDAEGKPVYQAMQASSSEVIADLVAEIQSLRIRVAALEAA